MIALIEMGNPPTVGGTIPLAGTLDYRDRGRGRGPASIHPSLPSDCPWCDSCFMPLLPCHLCRDRLYPQALRKTLSPVNGFCRGIISWHHEETKTGSYNSSIPGWFQTHIPGSSASLELGLHVCRTTLSFHQVSMKEQISYPSSCL